jgi:molybdopterin biosynthesis enzyme
MGTDILKTSRRSFLRGSPLGVTILLLALQINPVRLVAKPLLPVQPENTAMISVGRAYLDQAPEEADAARLRRLLDLAAEVSAQTLPGPEKERLAMRQCEDFRTGETVLVQGWVLSRTEARLYALAALEAEDRAAVEDA